MSDNMLPEPMDETQFIHAVLRLVGLDAAYANCLNEDNCEGSSDILELALRELQKMKKRQLPEGWHVGIDKNGKPNLLMWCGDHYYDKLRDERYNLSGRIITSWAAYHEQVRHLDLIEIDGIKTGAGDK